MEKVSLDHLSNGFCPQALFLYGTYKEDGTQNFGLFCWVSYFFDGELGVMACIGGEKLTKDRIKAGHVFSANLVTESLLPLADYLGNNDGYEPGKMDVPIEVESGAVLDVPVLKDSPWVFELEVKQSVSLDGSEIFLCKIRNVLAAKALTDESISAEERMRYAAPVVTAGIQRYFTLNPDVKGAWGDWKEN
ncbi:MAG: flavin reductase family protein [Oscillospiraceae bacterium]|jgi:flavin reductase (DIM6/NTAB) family NADH-FMN oxidoreductase RutF|nr:flavin reductase family protein [Oscillospiraceae bacterium]